MSTTIASLVTNLDTYFGDASTDRISSAERFQALTEATAWLLEKLGNDHAIKTYELPFFKGVNYYKISNSVSDLLASADLRRQVGMQTQTATHRSSRDIAEMISNYSNEFSWSIERKDDESYLVVNLETDKPATVVATFDSLTASGGTWEADTTTSDATNVTIDVYEYKEGSASLNFDVDVSQSGNNRSTIFNDELNVLDLSAYEDIGSWLLEVYIPDVTTITSYTLGWGSDSSNYWSATVTTDIDGDALANGWNTLKVAWSAATMTGTPDITAIDYVYIQLNYSGGQVDDTDFRLDNLRVANPEKLIYHYVSWDVGTTNAGVDIKAFTATSDIPFFSGKYDQYKYAVAHKAASILFYSERLRDEAQGEEREAELTIKRLLNLFPVSKVTESHNFKVSGLNFNKRGRRR